MRKVRAYVAEVDAGHYGTRYIGRKGALSLVPFFWQRQTDLLRMLNPKFTYHSRYTPSRDELKTMIVEITDLQKGMRQAGAVRKTVREFKESQPRAVVNKENKNNLYKIRLPMPVAGKSFFGSGKFGKTWEKAGVLRNFLSVRARFSSEEFWRDSTVVIIEMGVDGLNPVKVTNVPLIEFYCQSEQCRRRYNEIVAPRFYKPGLDTISPKTKLGEFA